MPGEAAVTLHLIGHIISRLQYKLDRLRPLACPVLLLGAKAIIGGLDHENRICRLEQAHRTGL